MRYLWICMRRLTRFYVLYVSGYAMYMPFARFICVCMSFFPQRLRYGYPFLPSLNDKACNVGIQLFQPPLSTRPTVVIIIVIPCFKYSCSKNTRHWQLFVQKMLLFLLKHLYFVKQNALFQILDPPGGAPEARNTCFFRTCAFFKILDPPGEHPRHGILIFLKTCGAFGPKFGQNSVI